ncbi:MAG: hypothetical protein M1834_000596 [Cirrosporium novae-zelandiae]|nr:MAG: hypothetical protein M1834_000596 [Cirrosporium novae-zelandiae]
MGTVEDILKGKYPAKAHAKKVSEYLKATDGVIYLEGQKTRMIEDNDEAAHFSYLAYNIKTAKLTLFIPPVDPESVIWSGLPLSPTEALGIYDVDEVMSSEDVNSYLASAQSSQGTVYAINGQISDRVTFLQFEHKNLDKLKVAIEECRAVKDDYEVALIRKANIISTEAHTAVLKAVKRVENERELEAIFLAKCISNGCREQAYHGIFASGQAAATLHYVHNDKPLSNKLNLLLDAGGEYSCYASDITRTFPINGSFTKESRQIYDIVLKMQKDCITMLHEGVSWDDVHMAAHKIAIDGLLELGIFKGDKDEILKMRTSVAFFPHGLGHYLGMDTHDTGGHANYEDPDAMFRYLRVRGKLPAGSVITVEPGIYFCKFIIEPYLKDPAHSQFISKDVLDKYWDVGGVRIEDNLLITKDGSENLTTAIREVEEMEKLIKS